MKKLFVFTIIVIISCSNKDKNQSIVIKSLYPYIQEFVTDDGNDSVHVKNRFYFLDNYEGYNKDSSFLDKFIVEVIDKNYSGFTNYHIIFYKKSNILNENTKDSLKDYNQFIEQKPILTYYWTKGNFEKCLDYFDNESGKVYFKSGSKVFNSLNSKQEDKRFPEIEISVDTSESNQ